MNTLGLERRWERPSKLGSRVGARAPLVALSACVVFGASFAISRATSPTATARGEAPPDIAAATVSATVPVSLAGVQPIEAVLEAPPPRPVAKPAPAPAPSAAPAPRHEASAPVHEAAAPVHEASPPVHEAPAPVHEEPAPVHEAPAPTHSSSGGSGGHSSSGGSFESSG